jgi:hypothetical protein
MNDITRPALAASTSLSSPTAPPKDAMRGRLEVASLGDLTRFGEIYYAAIGCLPAETMREEGYSTLVTFDDTISGYIAERVARTPQEAQRKVKYLQQRIIDGTMSDDAEDQARTAIEHEINAFPDLPNGVDLTATAREAARIWTVLGERTYPIPDAQRGADAQQGDFAAALEALVLAGTPSTASDCLAQLVLLVNRVRLVAENPKEEVENRIEAIERRLERTIVALSKILDIDVLPLGAAGEFFPDALRALGVDVDAMVA